MSTRKAKLKFYNISLFERQYESTFGGKYRRVREERICLKARLDIRDVETFGLSIAYRKYALCKAMGISYPCLSGVAFTARNSGKFIHRG